jgi:hypothetical protein
LVEGGFAIIGDDLCGSARCLDTFEIQSCRVVAEGDES